MRIGADKLRLWAETELKEQAIEAAFSQRDDTEPRLLHELQIHPVEVEMQDEGVRQMRDEEERAQKSYTELYDFAPVGYVTLDPSGAVRAANRTSAALLGIDRTLLLGRNFRFFVTKESRPLFAKFFDKVFANQSKESCELTLTTAENSWLFVQIEAVLTASGQECRVVISDISVRRKLEVELGNLQTELDIHTAALAAANIELEAFNFTVSHNLRRPLTAINGYCQALQDQCCDQIDDQCKGYLQEMYAGTLRMNQLINTLLKFSSVTRVKMHMGKIDLSKIAEKSVMQLMLAEPERQVTFQIAPEIVAFGDMDLLRSVLDNLISNAWRYTADQERAIIEFGVTERAGEWVYFVRDNGSGFESELAEMLFIPFQRLPGTHVEGHGIGLATVDRIVKRHGGRVWAESEGGKGAIFFFTLEPSHFPRYN